MRQGGWTAHDRWHQGSDCSDAQPTGCEHHWALRPNDLAAGALPREGGAARSGAGRQHTGDACRPMIASAQMMIRCPFASLCGTTCVEVSMPSVQELCMIPHDVECAVEYHYPSVP